MGIFRLAASIKNDVNSEESMIIDVFELVLKRMFKLILFLGLPYVTYLFLQLSYHG